MTGAATPSSDLALLAQAARQLTAAMADARPLNQTISQALADALGDVCLLWLPSERSADELELVALAKGHAVNLACPWDSLPARTRLPLPQAAQPLLQAVLETGQAVLLPRLDLDAPAARLAGETRSLLQELGAHSLLACSMGAPGSGLGVVVLLRCQGGGPRYGDGDRALAQALADQAALALASSKLAAADRHRSDEEHRVLFEASPLPMYVFDCDTLHFLAVNDSASALYGYAREELLRMRVVDLRQPDDAASLIEHLHSIGDAPTSGSAGHRRKDGVVINIEFTSRFITLAGRRARMAVVRDVTKQRALEEQLRQAQKMEAIGRLAGGVAHDFNNMLTVILNYTDFMLADLDRSDRRRDVMEEIAKASSRAADLTRQLLTFSRQQVVAPAVLDLNLVLVGLDKMLRRIVGEDVHLQMQLGAALGPVLADRGSIEQLIMNLVVNARDAMPTGGTLTIETGNVVLDEDFVRGHPGVSPGPHIMLSVTDSGTGIDAATQARIFEPFFTTKGQGQGTGLGLSTVFGIVQQSGGQIAVHSQPGQGTRFVTHLPRATATERQLRTAGFAAEPRGAEVILLVEDQDQVRAVLSGMLRRQGYDVIEACDAPHAVTLSEARAGAIDLLLTDVVMPQMSGTALARRLAAARPEMKVIFMSGYTDDATVRHGAFEPGTTFLQKPITRSTLMVAVRDLLDR